MITTGQTAVGLTAVAIDGTSNSEFRLTVHNQDNTDTVYVGNENVTVSTGLGIEKGQFLQIDMKPNDVLYAVSTKANHLLSWMRQVS